MVKKIVYIIRATPNVFGKRRDIGHFKTKAEAKKRLKKLLSPAKTRKLPGGKTIKLTSFRQGLSGTGINNPRIVKRLVFR